MSDVSAPSEEKGPRLRWMRHKRKGLYVHLNDVLELLATYHPVEVVKDLEELRAEV